jgi:hypothetical protein
MKSYLAAFTLLFSLVFLITGCSSTKHANDSNSTAQTDDTAEEWIKVNINEAIYFHFEKEDSEWTGTFRTYKLNAENEKVVDQQYVSANDSSWSDFQQFVDFLNIYEIGPQNEIEDWVPDSGTLPRRVYNFEVFDGETIHSFSYQDPINGIRDFWQVQNLLTFMTLVENDLQWVESGNEP